MGFWGFITTAALVVSLATKIQDAKEMAGLAFSIVTGGGEDAACKLCDKMVNVIVKEVELDDATNEGELQCNHLCLGFGRCVPTCERILKAMTSSTGFPCVAAGICPEVDDWGDVSCRFSYRRFGCEPSNQCSYKFPKCELRPGARKWKSVGRDFSRKLNDLQSGLRSRKKCSEKGAGFFCIREADTMMAWLASSAAILLPFVIGIASSVRAIETPGGADDRQWLTFWMVFVLFSVAEHFTDVLISRMPLYHEMKLFVLFWLMFRDGADKLYRSARLQLRRLRTLSDVLADLIGAPHLFPPKRIQTDDEFIETLPEEVQPSARSDLRATFQKFTSDAEVARLHGERALRLLWQLWNDVDPRYLVLHLDGAKNLPQMDENGSLDAYVVATLVPPAPESFRADAMVPFSPAKAKALDLNAQCPGGVAGLAKRMYRRMSVARRTEAVAEAIIQRRGLQVLSDAIKTPEGPSRQYSRVASRVAKRTLDPKWKQRLELRLGGGALNEKGEYDNKEAPYTSLRLEVWDHDLLSFDEFVGEVTVPLCPLMDGRTHKYSVPLCDPECKSNAPAGARGELQISIEYDS